MRVFRRHVRAAGPPGQARLGVHVRGHQLHGSRHLVLRPRHLKITLSQVS